jgi:outer membrane protein assembly factor BamB
MGRAMRRIAAVLVVGSVFGCVQMGKDFSEGIRAMSGKGGTHEERDTIKESAPIARDLATYQPKAAWASRIQADATDLVELYAEDRILVGAVQVSAMLATPSIGPLMMFDAQSGRKLWETPRKDFPKASHALVAMRPLIVVQATAPKVLHLSVIDPDTGAERWQREFPQPAQAFVDPKQSRIVVATAKDALVEISAFQMADGAEGWKLSLPGAKGMASVGELLPMGDDAVLVSDRLQRISLATGRLAWEEPHPAPGSAANTYAADEGIFVFNGNRLWFFGESGGKKWGPVSLGSTIARVATTTSHQGIVFAVARQGTLPVFDTIHAISVSDGRETWQHPVRDRIESGFLGTSGKLFYTTSASVQALDLKSGKLASRTPLPLIWVFNEVPDLLLMRGERVIIARERMGVVALSSKDGKMLWSQMMNVFRGAYFWYGVREQELFKSANRSAAQQKIAKEDRLWWNSFIASWDGFNKTLDVGSSRASYYAATGQSTSQWQATMGFVNALLGLSSAIDMGLKEAALDALVQRKRLEVTNSAILHARTFQGKYWIRPFGKRGRGIMLVDLETGKRADVEIKAPHYGADVYGPRLASIAVDAKGERLFTVGVDLNPDQWERYVKYRWGMPYPSLTFHRIADFKFGAIVWDDEALPHAAGSGDIEKAKKLMDAGTWVDSRTNLGGTALMEAAGKGNNELVRLLINRGADVNLANDGAMTALNIAAILGHASTARLLLKAGAKVGKAYELAAANKQQNVLEVLREAGLSAPSSK